MPGIGMIPTTTPAAGGGGMDMAQLLMSQAQPQGTGQPYGPGGDAWRTIVHQMISGGPYSGFDFKGLPMETQKYLRPG